MAMRDQILADLKEYLHEKVGLNPEAVSEQSHLFEELGLDSLDLIGAAQVLQRKYGISLDNEGIASVRTMGDVLDFVEKLVSRATSVSTYESGCV